MTSILSYIFKGNGTTYVNTDVDNIVHNRTNTSENTSVIEKKSNKFHAFFTNTFNEIIDENINNEFEILKVCVIGSQSSGKSRVLENIMNKEFYPTNQHLCTKQPVHLTLNTNNKKNDKKNNYNNEPYCIFNGEQINEDEIKDKIQEQFDLNKTVTDEPINITISNNDLIDSEFIDLPGIALSPEDLKSTTEEITLKYIKGTSNLILCVVPCTIQHLSTCPALALVQKYGLEHKTIVVFTMPDKVIEKNIGNNVISRIINTNDDDSDDKCNDIILNKYLGRCVVINREDDEISLSDNDDFSNEWFKKNVIDQIPNTLRDKEEIIGKLGVKNLIKTLNSHYGEIIKNKWIPSTQDTILNNIANYKIQLEKLGMVPSEINKREFTDFYYSNIIKEYIVKLVDIPIEYKYNDYNDFAKYFISISQYINNLQIKDVNHILNNIEIMSENNDTLSQADIEFKKKYVPKRFDIINDKIKNEILELFKAKMNIYLNVSKGQLLIMTMKTIIGCEEYNFDYFKVFVMNEILNIDFKDISKINYNQFQFFNIIEENNKYQIERSVLLNNIKMNEEAYDKLIEMNATLNTSNDEKTDE
jgi:hypothetical protein